MGVLQDIGWSTSYHVCEVDCRDMITKENSRILPKTIHNQNQ